jgi:hypothetical protein
MWAGRGSGQGLGSFFNPIRAAVAARCWTMTSISVWLLLFFC